MKRLPNGLEVFNSTPHVIRFWDPGWPEPIEIEPDKIVNARINESVVDEPVPPTGVTFVTTEFVGNTEGDAVIAQARESGANLIVGSIIAAQAYPGLVFAMVPCEGYERVPPAEKRMRPDKFTTYVPAPRG